MSDKSDKRLWKQVFVILSSCAFLGMMAFPLTALFRNPSQPSPAANSQASNPSAAEQIQAMEKGYEAVLEREPNNPVALQGLAEVRLKMNNLEGAIDPLEKLVKLYPEEEDLKTLLTAIKQQVAQTNATPETPQDKPQN